MSLSAEDAYVILREGIALGGHPYGMPYAASIMRPLERRGYFKRVVRKGFQTRWVLTEDGKDTRDRLLQRVATQSA